MKNATRQVVVFVLMVVLSFVLGTDVRGQVASFPFGTSEKVETGSVLKVNAIGVYVWAYDTNNQFVPYYASSWQNFKTNSAFTNKVDMDMFVVSELTNIFTEFLAETNTIYNIDVEKGLAVYVDSFMIAYDIGKDSSAIFSTLSYINMIPTYENGIYGMPDMSGFAMKLESDIPFYIANLRWARWEIGYRGNPVPFEIHDRNLDPSTDPIGVDGFLYLPADVISNSSTTNGSLWLKLSILSGDSFQSFDGDGNLIPERPMSVGISKNGINTTITVSGGDSGRGYIVQQSTDMKQWTDCSSITFVPPLSYLGERKNFEISTGESMVFFRTVTTNATPSR